MAAAFSKEKLESDAKQVFINFAMSYCPETLDIKVPSK
jgi:hypothetical protein